MFETYKVTKLCLIVTKIVNLAWCIPNCRLLQTFFCILFLQNQFCTDSAKSKPVQISLISVSS